MPRNNSGPKESYLDTIDQLQKNVDLMYSERHLGREQSKVLEQAERAKKRPKRNRPLRKG